MTFSEFANLLFPYIGKDQKKGDFVIELVQKIMKEPVLTKDKELEKGGKYNPLSQKQDTLDRIFNGIRPISSKVAREILSKLDKERFALYIDDFPDDTLDLIRSALCEKEIEISDKQVGEVCADLFVSILNDCANKKRKPRAVISKNQPLEVEPAIVPDEQMKTAIGKIIKAEEKKPPLPEDSSDGIGDISTQPLDRDVLLGNMLPMSVNPFSLDTDSDIENVQSRQMSHLRYRLDDLKKSFKYYGANFGRLDPRLKQKWKSVRIIDEFFRCYDLYNVADFVAINPLDFGYRVGAAAVGTVTDGLDYISKTLEFVNHMEIAVDYVPYDDETEKIHDDITRYVTTLHKYIDFLRKHSANSNLLGNTFFLAPDEYDDKKELERRSKKFREDLQSQYENIKRKKEDEQQENKENLQVD